MKKIRELMSQIKEHNIVNSYDSKYFTNHLKIQEYLENVHIQKKILYVKRYNMEISFDLIGDPKFKNLVFLNVGLGVNRSAAYKYAKLWNELNYKVLIFDSESWIVNATTQDGGELNMNEVNLLLILKNEIQKDYKKVGYHGVKLGGSTGVEYISEFSNTLPFDFYVLDSFYLSLNKILNANKNLKKLISKNKEIILIDVNVNVDELENLQSPVLAVYSADDAKKELYGYNELFNAKKEDKKWFFLETANLDHEPIYSNWDKYKRYIKNLLEII